MADGVPDGVPHLNVKQAVIRSVSRKLAEHIILKYEWLGTMGKSTYHYGIFYGDYCAGVCCVAVGGDTAGVYSHRPFKIEPIELATLVRGACVHWAPIGSNSKLVSWTCRLLAKETRCKIVLAYSDTDAGEIGTIYQACNWIYIGKGASTRQWVAPNDRVFDMKLPYNMKIAQGGTRKQSADALRRAGWHEQDSNPKHRYISILDRSDLALVQRVEQMRLPYPKRAASIVSDAPGVQPGEGSATLTAALQSGDQ